MPAIFRTMYRLICRSFLWLSCFVLLSLGTAELPVSAQNSPPCGIVDDIAFPVESILERTIARGYDDFSSYRARWGGNHVGLDVAFGQQGDPVHAAARGRVTYSDIAGWDTEKGVVIIEHTFPDGSVYYSLYGHVEETTDIQLPEVGNCVELGDEIAAVGDPDSSAQHLHFEIRNFLPNDGGPGYTEGNPLEEGWYHPLDFIALWQNRLSPAFVSYITFDLVPNFPPIQMADGAVLTASVETITVTFPPDQVLWRARMDSIVSGVTALPDGRVVAHARSGQTVTLLNGRYQAVWHVESLDEPFVTLDNTLIFVTEGGGLIAYTPENVALWVISAPTGGTDRISTFEAHPDQQTSALVMSLESGYLLRVVDQAGTILHDEQFTTLPLITPVMGGGWIALADDQLLRLDNPVITEIASVDAFIGRTAFLTADLFGNTFLYTGDSRDTLQSYDSGGTLRWEQNFPILDEMLLPPVLTVDNGCLVFGLDLDGQLSIFNAQTGDLIEQRVLYAGGDQSGRPNARQLEINTDGELIINPGFLTSITLDTKLLAADALQSCFLG